MSIAYLIGAAIINTILVGGHLLALAFVALSIYHARKAAHYDQRSEALWEAAQDNLGRVSAALSTPDRVPEKSDKEEA